MMFNGQQQLTACFRVKKKYNLSVPDNIIKCWCKNSVTHEIQLMRFYTRVVISCISDRITAVLTHLKVTEKIINFYIKYSVCILKENYGTMRHTDYFCSFR